MTRGLGEPGPIVVGVERSERSRDALALARILAGDLGTRLILVSVYPGAQRSDVMAQEAEAALDWVARPLGRVLDETRAVPCGSVPDGLQAVADAEGALAIVIGPSRRGPAGRVVPGSVGERLLHGASCPVAVAPRDYVLQEETGIKRVGVGIHGGSRGRRGAQRRRRDRGPDRRGAPPAQRRRALDGCRHAAPRLGLR